MKPISIKWELGVDRHGRRATMTCEGNEFRIEIEPGSQRDEGEIIRGLTRDMLLAAGQIATEQSQ